MAATEVHSQGRLLPCDTKGARIQRRSGRYYSLDSTNGLVLYGTYEAAGYGSNPSIPIDPPISVLPWLVQYGDSWDTAYTFNVTDPLFGVIPVSYTSTSTVDAYGTMVLPGIGPVSALRITEVEDYEEDIFGYEFPQLDTNWTWLAPGIGFAAQAVNLGPDSYCALSGKLIPTVFRGLSLPAGRLACPRN